MTMIGCPAMARCRSLSFTVALLALLGCASLPGRRGENPCPSVRPAQPLLTASDALAFRERLAAQDPAGRMRGDMICSRDPCYDFFEYACGAVVTRADRSARLDAFELQSFSNKWLLWNIAQVAVNDTTSPERLRIADFWRSCDNEIARSRDGVGALGPLFASIDAISGPNNLAATLALLHQHGIPALFSLGVTLDDERLRYVAVLGPGVTGLHYGFYLKADVKTRAKYRKYMAEVVKRALGKTIDTESVLAVEYTIARASDAMEVHEESADPLTSAPPELPGFDWATYDGHFDERLRRRRHDANYFRVLAELDLAGDLAPIKDYLRFTVVDSFAADLSPDVAALAARFYEDLGYPSFAGPGWRSCSERLERYLPDLMTHYYIGLTEDAAKPRRVADLALELHGFFARRIAATTWLSPETRQGAAQKVAGIQIFIGHSGELDDYGDVDLDPLHYLANVTRLRAREFAREVERIDVPVASRRPSGDPFTTNAWYFPAHNTAMIPQAILAPPFFGDSTPTPIVYGRLGGTIGHEMGHAFTGLARHYDARGRARDWWTAPDEEIYSERAECFVDDFDGMIVDHGYRVDGTRTLNENLADHVGLWTAWEAFEALERGRHGTTSEIPGVTDEQAFFIAWSQSYCGVPPEMTFYDHDPHAPGRARVNGTLRNFPPFAAAFGCVDGEAMARGAASCVLW